MAEDQVKNLAESDSMRPARIAHRLCGALTFLNGFSNVSTGLLQAAKDTLDTDPDWLMHYVKEFNRITGYGTFLFGEGNNQNKTETLRKSNPFSRVLERMAPIDASMLIGDKPS